VKLAAGGSFYARSLRSRDFRHQAPRDFALLERGQKRIPSSIIWLNY
jgi:hypothetical protein